MTKKAKQKKFRAVPWVAAVALVVVGFIAIFHLLSGPPATTKMDLSKWSRFPGAVVENGQVHIHPLDRKIVNQDGSGGQPNPPVNVMGDHLGVSGDFQITVGTGGAAASGAVLGLYGDVPLIYDEWRHEGRSVQLATSATGLKVSVWNGKQSTPVVTSEFTTAIPSSATLRVSRQGFRLHFFIDGREVGTVHDPGVFNSGQLWLGADAAAGTAGWAIKSVQAAGLGWGSVRDLPAASLTANHSDANALRNLAKSGAPRIGTAVSLYTLMSDSKYRALAIGQFNSWTPENEMKAQFIHPGPDTYSFADADALVDTALANGITVHGHALVFSEANPKWMQDSPVSARAGIMKAHITQIVSHYRGKVGEWDVVNEPLSDNDDDYQNGGLGLRSNIWSQAMGESYIDQALRAARAANPSAQLYINEYGLEQDGQRWDAMLTLIKLLQSRGVPLDGIGFQAHIHEESDQVDPDVLRQHFQQLAGLGLKVRISEIDVYGDDAGVQAGQYSDVLSACLASSNCTSWSTWGFTDLHGSTSSYTYPIEYGDDLMWSSTYQPKPAFTGVQAGLKHSGKSSPR